VSVLRLLDRLHACLMYALSLLLGIDEEKKKIACGLVDTIGITLFSFRGKPILRKMI
jgi:hypothetical protein